MLWQEEMVKAMLAEAGLALWSIWLFNYVSQVLPQALMLTDILPQGATSKATSLPI